MLALRKDPVVRKAISFAIVGSVNSLLDLGIFSIAWIVLGLSPLLANVLAWFIAVSGSYVMNCLTTFAAESGRKVELRTYVGFVGSGIGGLLAGTCVLFVAAMFVPVLAAKLMALVVSFALNFSMSHLVVFRS